VKPVVVVSGVLKSAWASNHTTPRSDARRPDIVPTAVLQFPESTRWNSPPATGPRIQERQCGASFATTARPATEPLDARPSVLEPIQESEHPTPHSI
jgi:hypothetical protein